MNFIFQPWQLLHLILAGWVNHQQQQINDYLRTENQVLREKLGQRRILLDDDQRRRLAVKGKSLGRKLLGQIGTLFTPDTILRWHRPQLVTDHPPNPPWAVSLSESLEPRHHGQEAILKDEEVHDRVAAASTILRIQPTHKAALAVVIDSLKDDGANFTVREAGDIDADGGVVAGYHYVARHAGQRRSAYRQGALVVPDDEAAGFHQVTAASRWRIVSLAGQVYYLGDVNWP